MYFWLVLEKSILILYSKHNLYTAVLITASGLQGKKPLVDRRMWIREVGKIDP